MTPERKKNRWPCQRAEGSVESQSTDAFDQSQKERFVVQPATSFGVSLPEWDILGAAIKAIIDRGHAWGIGWVGIIFAGSKADGFLGDALRGFPHGVFMPDPKLQVLAKLAEIRVRNRLGLAIFRMGHKIPADFHLVVPKALEFRSSLPMRKEFRLAALEGIGEIVGSGNEVRRRNAEKEGSSQA